MNLKALRAKKSQQDQEILKLKSLTTPQIGSDNKRVLLEVKTYKQKVARCEA